MYFLKTFAGLLCFFSLLTLNAQYEVPKPKGHILDMRNRDLSSFSVLDSAISKHSIFFTGEDHRFVKENTLIEMKFLRYLHKQAGVRHFFLELGPARGYIVNKYVNGDSTLFGYLQAATSRDYMRFYRRLKQFNDSLPVTEKISIWGIDVERFCDMPMLTLEYLLPKDKSIPESIGLSVESIQGLAAFYKKSYQPVNTSVIPGTGPEDITPPDFSTRFAWYSCENTSDSLVADFERQKTVYRNYLGESFELFSTIIQSLKDRSVWARYKTSDMVQQYVYREQFMFRQFRELIHRFPEGKFYGQFGRCHISQGIQDGDCNWFHHNSIASRINGSDDPLMHGKVLSIAIFYPNDYYTYSRQGLQPYIDAAPERECYLFKTGLSDNSDSMLHQRYPYLIINNINVTSDARKGLVYNDTGAVPSEKLYYEATGIDLAVDFVNFNYKNLNSTFSGTGSSFNTQVPFISLGVLWLPENFTGLGAVYQFAPEQAITINNTTRILLNRRMARFMAGYSFVPTPRLSLFLYAPLGFGNQVLTVTEDSANYALSPTFGTKRITRYTNPGTTIGAGLDIRFALTHVFALKLNAGYDYDISYYRWRDSNKDRTVSPRTSFTNYRIGAGLTILIPQ